MLVFGAGDPGSVLHAKLMATHSSMIDTPCCTWALYGAVTKWTPVGVLDTVRDRAPDCAVVHPKLMATHTSVVDTPSCNWARYGAVTKWTPVGMHDTVRDGSHDGALVNPKSVTTHLSVTDAASCHFAFDGAITKRTLVRIVARTFFAFRSAFPLCILRCRLLCLPFRLSGAPFRV